MCAGIVGYTCLHIGTIVHVPSTRAHANLGVYFAREIGKKYTTNPNASDIFFGSLSLIEKANIVPSCRDDDDAKKQQHAVRVIVKSQPPSDQRDCRQKTARVWSTHYIAERLILHRTGVDTHRTQFNCVEIGRLICRHARASFVSGSVWQRPNGCGIVCQRAFHYTHTRHTLAQAKCSGCSRIPCLFFVVLHKSMK